LSVEINLQAYRVMHQVALWVVEYKDVMMDGIDELPKSWFRALREIEKEKFKVAKAYNRSDEDMWRLIIVYAHLLFSHPTNGTSVRLPSKKLWSFYWKVSKMLLGCRRLETRLLNSSTNATIHMLDIS
jgi:hypothetical protein